TAEHHARFTASDVRGWVGTGDRLLSRHSGTGNGPLSHAYRLPLARPHRPADLAVPVELSRPGPEQQCAAGADTDRCAQLLQHSRPALAGRYPGRADPGTGARPVASG